MKAGNQADPNKPTYRLLAAVAKALEDTRIDHAKALVFLRSLNAYLIEEMYFWRLAYKPDMSGYFVVYKDYRPNILTEESEDDK